MLDDRDSPASSLAASLPAASPPAVATAPPSATDERNHGIDGDPEPRRYFARPDAGERPLTLRETLLIVVSTHLGVRTRAQRQADFRRANGLHLFIAGVLYFALIVGLLIALVNWLSR